MIYLCFIKYVNVTLVTTKYFAVFKSSTVEKSQLVFSTPILHFHILPILHFYETENISCMLCFMILVEYTEWKTSRGYKNSFILKYSYVKLDQKQIKFRFKTYCEFLMKSIVPT